MNQSLSLNLSNFTLADVEAESRKRFKYYIPTPKQFAFHAASTVANILLFLAGNRTGKTDFMCFMAGVHLTGNYPSWWVGHKFTHGITAWVASENYEIVRNVLQRKLLGGYDTVLGNAAGFVHPDLILKKAMLAGVNGAVDYIQVKHKSGGVSTLYFKSYKQGREKFQGARCDLIGLDEEPPYDIFLECLIRLSDVDGRGQGQMLVSMTPLKGMTQLMTYFLRTTVPATNDDEQEEVVKVAPETVIDGRYYIQATWDDNPHLSEETKAQLRASLQPYELEAREKGIPLMGSGIVYQIPESVFLLKPEEEFKIPEHWAKVCGMDVGFNAPTAVVFLAINRDTDVVYVYGEYSCAGLTAVQHAQTLLPMGLDWMPIVCDPAAKQGSQRDGARLVDDYTQVGMKITLAKYAKERSVDIVFERIRTGKFKVFSSCRKFMDEWRGYSRDDKGKIMKGNDHLMNALEYAVLDGLPLAKTKAVATYQRSSTYRDPWCV